MNRRSPPTCELCEKPIFNHCRFKQKLHSKCRKQLELVIIMTAKNKVNRMIAQLIREASESLKQL